MHACRCIGGGEWQRERERDTHTHTHTHVYRSLLVAERGARQVDLFKSRMPQIPLQGEEVWCNIHKMPTSVCVCVCVWCV